MPLFESSEETGKLRIELRSEIEKNRIELITEIGKNRVEIEKIRVEVSASKADTLRWMVIFWIGQIGVLSGIIFAMLKLYFK